MATDRLDVIIFGATGFTGKYTVFESIKVLNGLTWGIAGRSKVCFLSTHFQFIIKYTNFEGKIGTSS